MAPEKSSRGAIFVPPPRFTGFLTEWNATMRKNPQPHPPKPKGAQAEKPRPRPVRFTDWASI